MNEVDHHSDPSDDPGRGAVLIVGGAAATAEADRLEGELRRDGGVVLAGAWRERFVRPLGGLVDVIDEAAARVQQSEPELLQRFGWSLVNLFFPWRRERAALPVGELRAGLCDLVLRGDQTLVHQFFQKRNVRPQILSYLVQFVVETAAAIARERGAPVLLRLDGVHRADELAVSAIAQIARYARVRRLPLTLVAVAERVEGTTLVPLAADGGEWRRVEPGEGGVDRSLDAAVAGALATATAFALPLRRDDLLALVGDGAGAAGAVDSLVDAGWLRPAAEERWRPAPGAGTAAAGAVSGERWREIHRRLLAGAEGEDPFAAAWHAAEAERTGELRARWLAAMERAWAVSAYTEAVDFAERAIAAPPRDDGDELDADLLRALLSYEAERYEEADRAFAAALARPRGDADRNFIEYLSGYNCIFGTGDFPRGIEILGRVLRHYEAIGDRRGAAYIRNSMAFAHVRSRNVGEAIDLERLNLEQVEGSDVGDSFLLSILQLNLGRIYRNTGEAGRALDLFRKGLSVERAEPSSHVLLLFYATLGGFQSAAGDSAAALRSYHHAFELVRDMQLDSVKDQVFDAYSKGPPALPRERVTRADQMRFNLHFHLGTSCLRLGLADRAAAYRDALLARADLLGEAAANEVAAAFSAAAGPPPPDVSTAPEFARETEELLDETSNLLRVEARGGEIASAAAAALAAGETVALVTPRELGGGATVVDCVLLYDPRERATAERLTEEFGGSHIPRATSALALPAAVDLFVDLADRPLVQQAATLRPGERARLDALLPVQAAVQVLSPRFDGLVHEVLKGFAERTGVPVAAAVPFHLWRRDLADTPRRALTTFLIGSADRLVLGDRLLVKAHGATAVENLRPFRPRLSEEALVFSGRTGGEEASLLIRIKRRGGYATDDLLKLHPKSRPLLDLCDGRRTVDEIARLVAGERTSGAARLGGFLRDLWRRGALCFDDPQEAPPAVRRVS